jgi:hypothetical protein
VSLLHPFKESEHRRFHGKFSDMGLSAKVLKEQHAVDIKGLGAAKPRYRVVHKPGTGQERELGHVVRGNDGKGKEVFHIETPQGRHPDGPFPTRAMAGAAVADMHGILDKNRDGVDDRKQKGDGKPVDLRRDPPKDSHPEEAEWANAQAKHREHMAQRDAARKGVTRSEARRLAAKAPDEARLAAGKDAAKPKFQKDDRVQFSGEHYDVIKRIDRAGGLEPLIRINRPNPNDGRPYTDVPERTLSPVKEFRMKEGETRDVKVKRRTESAVRADMEQNRQARKHAPDHAHAQLDGEYELLKQELRGARGVEGKPAQGDRPKGGKAGDNPLERFAVGKTVTAKNGFEYKITSHSDGKIWGVRVVDGKPDKQAEPLRMDAFQGVPVRQEGLGRDKKLAQPLSHKERELRDKMNTEKVANPKKPAKKAATHRDNITVAKLHSLLKKNGHRKSGVEAAGMVRGWRPQTTGYQLSPGKDGNIHLTHYSANYNGEKAAAAVKRETAAMEETLKKNNIEYTRDGDNLIIKGGEKHHTAIREQLRQAEADRAYELRRQGEIRERIKKMNVPYDHPARKQMEKDAQKHGERAGNLWLKVDNLKGVQPPDSPAPAAAKGPAVPEPEKATFENALQQTKYGHTPGEAGRALKEDEVLNLLHGATDEQIKALSEKELKQVMGRMIKANEDKRPDVHPADVTPEMHAEHVKATVEHDKLYQRLLDEGHRRLAAGELSPREAEWWATPKKYWPGVGRKGGAKAPAAPAPGGMDPAKAVKLYAKGDAHSGVNRALWNGKALTPAQEEHAKGLDAAMAPSTSDRVLYRGVDHYYGDVPRPDLKPGDVVPQPGFVSTSRNRSTGMQFANTAPSRRKGGVLYEITAPAGTPAIDMPGGGRKKGIHNNEEETLLPRGGHLVIDSVSKPDKNNVTRVKARWAK